MTNYPTSPPTVQEKHTPNPPLLADVPARGRIIALDLGTKRIGVAVTDETQTVARPLDRIERRSWKDLLKKVKGIVAELDAAALIIGLPYNTDGTESEMSADARRLARNFSLSLDIGVFLQDERNTSYEAKARLWESGATLEETRARVDSEAAVIILDDFLATLARERPSKN